MNGFFISAFIIIAFIFGGISLIRTYLRFKRIREEWIYVQNGIVLKKRIWTHSRKGRSTARSYVEFTIDGKTYEGLSFVGQHPALRAGKSVGLFYNPENPEEIIVNTFTQRGTMFLLAGILFGGVGVTGLIIYLSILLN